MLTAKTFNRALNDFLNSNALTFPSMALYPLWDRQANRLAANHKTSSRSVARHLASTWHHVPRHSGDKRSVSVLKEYETWKTEATDPLLACLHTLHGRLQELEEYLFGAYLQGSLATLDYIAGFSDVDMILIVKKGVIADPKKLNHLRKKLTSLRRLLYRIDPLQHHGFSVVLEEEMSNFASLFPLELFEKSICFLGPKTLEFSVSSASQVDRLGIEQQFFERELRLTRMNAYDVKFFVSKVLILPTLFLQQQGKAIMKKDSFAQARQQFGKEPWGVVDRVEVLRKQWRGPKLLIRLLGPLLQRLSSYGWQVLLCKLVRTNQVSKEEYASLKRQALALVKRMREKI